MGIPVLIYGKSGSGKSRSLKFFEKDEILFINVEGKTLPFRHKFDFTLKTDDVDYIIDKCKKMPCKIAVIDDAGYIMTHLFMSEHRIKKGNASFEMYNEIADRMFFLIKKIKNELPDDVIVYILMHEETGDDGETKLKTLGKILDGKVCLEGMVTICLRCMSKDGKHFFRTVTDGSDITKTPEEMFEQDEIDNNLKLVDSTIREYYGFQAENKTEERKNEQ